MVKRVAIAMMTMLTASACTASSGTEYVAVDGVSNADCAHSEYVCVKARTDKTLAELARFGRVSLETLCERNGISKGACTATGLVEKKTALLAGKRI